MMKIYKNDLDDSVVHVCSQIEDDSWVRLVNPTDKEIEEVSSKVGIPTTLISQVLVEKELPRIKQIPGAVLVVMDVPYMKDKSIKNKYITCPLGIIICDNLHVITVSLQEHAFMDEFAKGNVETFFTYKKSRFLIQIFLKASEVYLSTLSLIDEDIQKMEKNTYYSTNNRVLINFLNMQKTLVYFLTSLQANSHVLERLYTDEILTMYDEDKVLLGDAVIENKQCIETSIVFRDILDSTMDTYGSIISNNLNVIMKFLAGITIVFSIPTMISSFLGMNVPLGVIGQSDYSFLVVCIVSFLVSFVIACWLKKRNML
jgi:magnesium transporter